MNVVILGANGQLGSVVSAVSAARHSVTALTRESVDITDAFALDRQLTTLAPDAIINCAAFSRVDEAEDQPVRALMVNAMAVRSLAGIANRFGATLVHYSSDFVFDGTGIGPNDETRTPNPRGVYAISKLAGEWFAADASKHLVLRVESLFGGARRKSSIDTMLESILAGRRVRAFADRTVSPSYVRDVAEATLAALERPIPSGLYHCVNSGATNWSELARELARLAGRADAEVEDVRMADLTMHVRRPLNAAMSNAKLAATGVVLPDWRDALARYVCSYVAQRSA
jgi:dTDP-4-dehydrorhamnose reductase